MAVVTSSGLRLQNAGVNILAVHPELRHVTRMAFAQMRGIPTLVVTSGARSHKQQTALYAAYRAGRGPLAANPNFVGATGRVGSAHQVQKPGGYKHGRLDNTAPFAYAIDISPKDNPRSWDKLRSVMEAAGGNANLWHLGEPWHYVMDLSWVPQVVTGHGMAGTTTQSVQRRFVQAGTKLKIDGQHGPATTIAVKRWQRKIGRKGMWVNGDWTRDDHALFIDHVEALRASADVARRAEQKKQADERAAVERLKREEVNRQKTPAPPGLPSPPTVSRDRQMLLNIQASLNKYLGS